MRLISSSCQRSRLASYIQSSHGLTRHGGMARCVSVAARRLALLALLLAFFATNPCVCASRLTCVHLSHIWSGRLLFHPCLLALPASLPERHLYTHTCALPRRKIPFFCARADILLGPYLVPCRTAPPACRKHASGGEAAPAGDLSILGQAWGEQRVWAAEDFKALHSMVFQGCFDPMWFPGRPCVYFMYVKRNVWCAHHSIDQHNFCLRTWIFKPSSEAAIFLIGTMVQDTLSRTGCNQHI